jgi:hypothetical protein
MSDAHEDKKPAHLAAKQIGIVGSPSTTTELVIDIVDSATRDTVLGDMVYLSHRLDSGENLLALGTVGSIETRNRWHEDPNMRGVLRVHGELPHLSGDGDVRTAKVTVQAVYRTDSIEPPFDTAPTEDGGALGMSPTTGYPVRVVTDELVTGLVQRHSDAIVYLGRIYRNTVKLPMFVRHFDDPDLDGAYHTGLFGRSGSGKTALAAHLMAMQLRHPQMGMMVFDPQGQFSRTNLGIPLDLKAYARRFGREVLNLSIAEDIRLPQDADLLLELIEATNFWSAIGMKNANANRETARSELEYILRGNTGWCDSEAEELLRTLLNTLAADDAALARIYATAPRAAQLKAALQRAAADNSEFRRMLNDFDPVHGLFRSHNAAGNRRRSLHGLVTAVIADSSRPKPYVVIDLSNQSGNAWLDSDQVKARLIRKITSLLRRESQEQWSRTQKRVNCVVVFDEAHQFAGNNTGDDELALLSRKLVTAVRETRKVGIGWTFITQQIRSLHPQIYAQLSVKAFGYGLTTGSDLDLLQEEVGTGGALELYKTFANPNSRSGEKSYPFMVTGPISPLSFTSAPVFLEVFTDEKEFRRANRL